MGSRLGWISICQSILAGHGSPIKWEGCLGQISRGIRFVPSFLVVGLVRAEMGLFCNRQEKLRGALVGEGLVASIFRGAGTVGKRVRSFIFAILGVAGMVRCEWVRSFVFVNRPVGAWKWWRIEGGQYCVAARRGRFTGSRLIDVAELLIFWHWYTTGANNLMPRRLRARRRKCLVSGGYGAQKKLKISVTADWPTYTLVDCSR